MQRRVGQSGAGFTKVTPLVTLDASGLLQARPIWLSAHPVTVRAKPREQNENHAAKRRFIMSVSSDLVVTSPGQNTPSRWPVKPWSTSPVRPQRLRFWAHLHPHAITFPRPPLRACQTEFLGQVDALSRAAETCSPCHNGTSPARPIASHPGHTEPYVTCIIMWGAMVTDWIAASRFFYKAAQVRDRIGGRLGGKDLLVGSSSASPRRKTTSIRSPQQ